VSGCAGGMKRKDNKEHVWESGIDQWGRIQCGKTSEIYRGSRPDSSRDIYSREKITIEHLEFWKGPGEGKKKRGVNYICGKLVREKERSQRKTW